jgi:tetratricopeptide (TPR) repeat protein
MLPHRAFGALLFVTFAAACAAKAPLQSAADLARADSLLRDGCYICLQQAHAIYTKLNHAKGIHDTAILIAVRDKELGIPSDTVLPPGPLADAATLIVGETSGMDAEQRAAATGRGRPPIEPDNAVRRALDPSFGTDLTTTYVALTIDCESPRLIESVDVAGLTKQYEGVPLMLFRLGRCGRPANAPRLAALRSTDSRWTDTLFWEARAALIGSPKTGIDFPAALKLFAEGRAAIPKSLAMTMGWANVNLSSEEFEPALSGFDDVLAEFPTHRDALIGRVTALSNLLRHPDAIASATRVIDLGTWHIGDAYYWRAWNRYHLKEYETAWADVENAIRGLSNSGVYMLSGLIAYARTDLPTAVERFDRAYEINSSACDALWMSGLVSIDQEQLAIAAPKFTRGMSCFISAAASLRQDLDRREKQVAARGTPATDREIRQMDRLRRDAENADERSAQSAFNAAQCYARTGERGMALNLVDVAIGHPRMKEKADALKTAIEKLPKNRN